MDIGPWSCPRPTAIWIPDLVERFARFLPVNTVACTLRLVNKATAAQFRGREQYATVRLSQAVPQHAFTQRWSAPGATRPLTLPKRRQLLCLTAASGSIPNLETAVAAAGLVLTSETVQRSVLEAAASAGQLEVCRWLLEQGCSACYQATQAAAKAGQQAVCCLFLSGGLVAWDEFFLRAAAAGGHPDLVEWLLRRRPSGPLGPTDGLRCLGGELCADLLVCAAEGCDAATLQSLCRRCGGAGAPAGRQQPAAQQPAAQPPEPEREMQPEAALEWLPPTWLGRAVAAAACSHTPDWRAKVEWLESLPPPPPPGYAAGANACACVAAAGCPDGEDALGRLAWLVGRGYPLHGMAASQAAAAGNAAALEFLLGAATAGGGGGGTEPPAELAVTAAEAGHVAVLAVLRARGCPFESVEVAAAAARRGHLRVVVWVEEALGVVLQGMRIGGGGHRHRHWHQGQRHQELWGPGPGVELLAWLVARGAVLDAAAFGAAVVEAGSEEVLEWMVERGCDMGTHGTAYVLAASNDDLATLRALRGLGCPWGPAGHVFTRCVAEGRPLPVLRCLADLGCPIDWAAAVRAAKRGRGGAGHGGQVSAWLAEQARQHGRNKARRSPPPPPLPPALRP